MLVVINRVPITVDAVHPFHFKIIKSVLLNNPAAAFELTLNGKIV